MVVFLLKAGPFIQYTKHITAVCHYGLSATSKWLRGGNRSEKRGTKESFDLRKSEWEASPPSQCLWPARCFIGLKWPHVDSIYVIKSRSLHTTIKKKNNNLFQSAEKMDCACFFPTQRNSKIPPRNPLLYKIPEHTRGAAPAWRDAAVSQGWRRKGLPPVGASQQLL